PESNDRLVRDRPQTGRPAPAGSCRGLDALSLVWPGRRVLRSGDADPVPGDQPHPPSLPGEPALRLAGSAGEPPALRRARIAPGDRHDPGAEARRLARPAAPLRPGRPAGPVGDQPAGL